MPTATISTNEKQESVITIPQPDITITKEELQGQIDALNRAIVINRIQIQELQNGVDKNLELIAEKESKLNMFK